MSILDRIIADKKKEMVHQKECIPVGMLEKSVYIDRKAVSLASCLKEEGTSGIIAEFKRKSPSGGRIHEKADPVAVATAYSAAGASGLSVLTDFKYFGGTRTDLSRVRLACKVPVLRKDFIIDEYQVLESKAIGADVVLLIASVLDAERVKQLAGLAKSVGLEVLLEIHEEKELDRINESVDLIGVNNRDLKRMETNIETSKRLGPKIPDGFIKITESGISAAGTIRELRDHGFSGFLIGEYFMRQGDPGETCREFINGILS